LKPQPADPRPCGNDVGPDPFNPAQLAGPLNPHRLRAGQPRGVGVRVRHGGRGPIRSPRASSVVARSTADARTRAPTTPALLTSVPQPWCVPPGALFPLPGPTASSHEKASGAPPNDSLHVSHSPRLVVAPCLSALQGFLLTLEAETLLLGHTPGEVAVRKPNHGENLKDSAALEAVTSARAFTSSRSPTRTG
jgi:hypothetical protein